MSRSFSSSSSSSSSPPRRLPFETLDAYSVALSLCEAAGRLVVARGFAESKDQLRRAAQSVALNLAEGSGKEGRDRARFYRIARASACECAAALDVLCAFGAVRPGPAGEARVLCERLYAMLTPLVLRR